MDEPKVSASGWLDNGLEIHTYENRVGGRNERHLKLLLDLNTGLLVKESWFDNLSYKFETTKGIDYEVVGRIQAPADALALTLEKLRNLSKQGGE